MRWFWQTCFAKQYNPKPLLTINNIPLIEYSIKILKELGVNEIAINVHHLKQKFLAI